MLQSHQQDRKCFELNLWIYEVYRRMSVVFQMSFLPRCLTSRRESRSSSVWRGSSGRSTTVSTGSPIPNIFHSTPLSYSNLPLHSIPVTLYRAYEHVNTTSVSLSLPSHRPTDKALLCLFGSSKNGFGFRDSDLDICMTLEGHDTAEVKRGHMLAQKPTLASKYTIARKCTWI